MARRILIVEDERMVGLMLEGMVRELRYSVVSLAQTPAEALLQLSDRPLPEVALVDLRLGPEMAVEVLQRRTELGVPVVITTGYDVEDIPEEMRARWDGATPFPRRSLSGSGIPVSLLRSSPDSLQRADQPAGRRLAQTT